MNEVKKGVKLYALLCSIFCVIIITGNLIFQKFINFEIFNYNVVISVGILLYPVTFLISDLVTEFYGKKNAAFMVKVSVVCSLVILILIKFADTRSGTEWSKVNDATFNKVFGVYSSAVIISIIANFVGQIADIHIFSQLKQKTGDKYLWLRNILSTLMGLTVDAFLITILLSIFGFIDWEHFKSIMLGGIIFKAIASIISVPLYYLIYFIIDRYALAKTI